MDPPGLCFGQTAVSPSPLHSRVRPVASSPVRSARRLSAGLGALALFLCAAALPACTSGLAGVAKAPFRLRPDTTVWGSLLGPFEGTVVESSTGSPIAGALVVGTWAFEDDGALPVPAGSYATSVVTAADGSYSLPILPVRERRLSLLRRFTLLVYKAGYVGYRSDYRADDSTPRHDFAQLNNKARLDRLTTGESRLRNLVFLGGGGLVQRAAQAEVIQAALELAELQPDRKAPAAKDAKDSKDPSEAARAAAADAGKAAAARPARDAADAGPPSLAQQLLSLTDVEGLASQKEARVYEAKAAPERSLVFNPPLSVQYSGVHYRAADRPESHDILLRAYRLPSGRDADTLWKRLREQLVTPQLKELTGLAALVPPAQRAPTPLLPEAPAVSPPLRDGQAGRHAMPMPTLLPNAPPIATPLRIDASLRVHDAKQRAYGVAVLLRQHGLVLELICGADLCESEPAASALLVRVLGRL